MKARSAPDFEGHGDFRLVRKILKYPDNRLRHRREIMELTVRLATDEEKRELWPICDARLTRYAYYRKRSSRGMGIFACEGRTAI
jgi:F420H(2)-dependent quinone reductase